MNPSLFATPADFRTWLTQHHATATELWLGIAKKGSGIPSITYAEALDEALCFGWIDGLKKSHDALHFKLRLTPRKPKGLWSKINVAHVERLIGEGRMMPAGLAQVDAAKRDGRWDAAYHGGATSTVPADLQAVLDAEPKIAAFFADLDRTNRYAMLFRLQTAMKPETRAKRLAVIVQMLREGRGYHATRAGKTPPE